jgi:hypothetical protein
MLTNTLREPLAGRGLATRRVRMVNVAARRRAAARRLDGYAVVSHEIHHRFMGASLRIATIPGTFGSNLND